jgi:hypothetical protein
MPHYSYCLSAFCTIGPPPPSHTVALPSVADCRRRAHESRGRRTRRALRRADCALDRLCGADGRRRCVGASVQRLKLRMHFLFFILIFCATVPFDGVSMLRELVCKCLVGFCCLISMYLGFASTTLVLTFSPFPYLCRVSPKLVPSLSFSHSLSLSLSALSLSVSLSLSLFAKPQSARGRAGRALPRARDLGRSDAASRAARLLAAH